VFACPEGGATLAAARRARRIGAHRIHDVVVLFIPERASSIRRSPACAFRDPRGRQRYRDAHTHLSRAPPTFRSSISRPCCGVVVFVLVSCGGGLGGVGVGWCVVVLYLFGFLVGGVCVCGMAVFHPPEARHVLGLACFVCVFWFFRCLLCMVVFCCCVVCVVLSWVFSLWVRLGSLVGPALGPEEGRPASIPDRGPWMGGWTDHPLRSRLRRSVFLPAATATPPG